MRATKTVPQSLSTRKSTATRIHFYRLFASNHGVVVLAGYSIKVRLDRGHLILEDGIGPDRRAGRFPKVHHRLRRIVIVGIEGMVSLAALEWLSDQNIALVMLERDGSVRLSTGPVAASDTRLRRAQACAGHSDCALDIARHLVDLKLSGQEALVRDKLGDYAAADSIARFRSQLGSAKTIDDIRMIEGHGGGTYWTAWQRVKVLFPKSDLARVPDHWRVFGTRRSPISGTSRRAPNPINAILNYLYTVLESESRLAIQALGLDPGFGLLHVDHATRDSLVYDLMEPIRPKIDAYVLHWITRTPLKRSWFFEQSDGTCRLMASLTVQLSETASTWAAEIAPVVEWFVQTLSSTASQKGRIRTPGTRLTQRRRYEGQGKEMPFPERAPVPGGVCRSCGAAISPDAQHCHSCSLVESGKRLARAQKLGRTAAVSPESLKKRSEVMTLHKEALRNWKTSDVPDWLTDDVYAARIQPALARLSKKAIESVLQVSKRYAYEIACGAKIPHRRHWVKLAAMAGLGSTDNLLPVSTRDPT
jgi:CRISPR-associated endonuclease Cas1